MNKLMKFHSIATVYSIKPFPVIWQVEKEKDSFNHLINYLSEESSTIFF